MTRRQSAALLILACAAIVSAHATPDGALLRLGRGRVGYADRTGAFSPDGALIAFAATTGIYIYDSRTWSLLNFLENDSLVLGIAFSRDGRILAGGTADQTVVQWDSSTGERLKTLIGHAGAVISVAFSPDGSTFASASVTQEIRVWDARTGEFLREFTGQRGGFGDSVTSIAFSRDGSVLASGSRDATVQLWDPGTGSHLITLYGHTDAVWSVAFDADGSTLASGSSDGSIRVWDARSGAHLATLEHDQGPPHDSGVHSVAFAPDGPSLASANSAGTIILWNVRTGTRLGSLVGHATTGWTGGLVMFSPDGSTIVSSTDDGTIRVWDAHSTAHLGTLAEFSGALSSLAFSLDGNSLACGYFDGAIRLWDPHTGKHLDTLTGHPGWVESVAFSADGITVAGASRDMIRIWDVRGRGRAIGSLEHMYVESVAFSPDGRTLASAGRDGTVRLWHPRTGGLIRTLTGHTAQVQSVVFSPDGLTLASGGPQAGAVSGAVQEIRLWDAGTGDHLATLTGHLSTLFSLTFSPDSKILASASNDETVVLWDVRTGLRLDTLGGHTGTVRSVAFSPDGSMLASGSADQTVRLWDPRTALLIDTLTGHMSGLSSVAFSPDGQTLATGSYDGTVLLWPAVHQQSNQSPALASMSAKTGREGRALVFAVIASDPDGDDIGSIRVQSILPSGASFGPDMSAEDPSSEYLFSWTPDYTQASVYELAFLAEDTLGAVSEPVVVTITVLDVNRPPAFQPTPSQSVQVGDRLTFELSATDPDGDSLTYEATSLPPGASFDPPSRQAEWRPDSTQSGAHTATFRVTDGKDGGEDTLTVTISVGVPQGPPTFDPEGPKEVFEGEELVFSVRASDPDGDAFRYTETRLPLGASFDSTAQRITWTPNFSQSGSVEFTFVVEDSHGAESEPLVVRVTVHDTNREPQILPITVTGDLVEGTPVEFTVTATDPDTDNSLTLSMSGQPDGASLTVVGVTSRVVGRFEWTPQIGDAGPQTMTFAVSDGRSGSADATVEFEVDALDSEPPTGTIRIVEVIERGGVAYVASPDVQLQLAASDNLSAASSIRAELRDTSGGWTPLAPVAATRAWTLPADDGEKTVEVRFTDEVGNVSDPIDTTVVLDMSPPVISHTPLTSVELGSPAVISGSTSDVSPTERVVRYRAGGSSIYVNVPVEGSGGDFTSEIPAGSIEFGAAYYLEATDTVGNVTTFPEGGESDPVGIRTRGEFAASSEFAQQTWNLYSAPVLQDSSDLTALLNEKVGADAWRADRWSRESGGNVQISTPATNGVPFWLITKSPFRPTMLGEIVSPAAAHRVQLVPGWNLVSNPYGFPVPFGNVRVVAGNDVVPLTDPAAAAFTEPMFWRWMDSTPDDITNGVYHEESDVAEPWVPWTGYWLHASEETELAILPFRELSEGEPQQASPASSGTFVWSSILTVANGQGSNDVRIGVSPSADWGNNALDVLQPPSRSGVSLSLTHGSNSYQQLALPEGAAEWLWPARAAAYARATIQIIGELPSRYRLYMELPHEALRVRLRPGVEVTLADGEYDLAFRLTRDMLGRDLLGSAPRSTGLLPNYPNPFNPETWIPFALATSADVSLRVYATTGELVRVIELGRVESGRYSDRSRAAYWDGKNDNGEAVASGTYAVEFRAGDTRAMRRIVLAK